MILSLLLLISIFFYRNELLVQPLYSLRDTTGVVKFVASLLVVAGHLFSFYIRNDFLQSEFVWGSLCVSLFLFFSGYGLMHGLLTYGDSYLRGFIKKKVVHIVIPLLTAYIVAIFAHFLIEGNVDSTDVIRTLYYGGRYLMFSWYVTAILYLYLIFYICCKVFPRHLHIASISFFVICAIVFVIYVKKEYGILNFWWIQSSFCFLYGLIYRKHEGYISKALNPKIILLIFALFTVFYNLEDFRNLFAYEKWNILITLLLSNKINLLISDTLFSVITIFLITRVNFFSKKRSIYDCYYEIYLNQAVVMYALSTYINNPYILFFSTFVVLILLSLFMNYLNKMVTNIVK